MHRSGLTHRTPPSSRNPIRDFKDLEKHISTLSNTVNNVSSNIASGSVNETSSEKINNTNQSNIDSGLESFFTQSDTLGNDSLSEKLFGLTISPTQKSGSAPNNSVDAPLEDLITLDNNFISPKNPNKIPNDSAESETHGEGIGEDNENGFPNNNSAENSDTEQNQANIHTNANTSTENHNQNKNNAENMALTASDILNGIKEFSHSSQDEIRQFIANVDMIHTLATAQRDTVLTVVRARLANAYKLGDISASTWAEIKASILEKYRSQVSFETAQEKLLAIRQGQKETLETYADRVKKLLDSLNSATTNANADVQASNRSMNESLAIRKFKQNILDEKIRLMALSAEHETLYAAISHASQKREQLNSSNIVREKEPDKKQNTQNSNNGNANNGAPKQNKNQKNQNKFDPCTYCGKQTHSSDRCFSKDKQQPMLKNDGNKNETSTHTARYNRNTNTAAAIEHEQESEDSDPGEMSSSLSARSNRMQLQPFLN